MKVVFEAKAVKSGDRLLITIPRKIHRMVVHGKRYIVQLEPVES